MTWLIRAALTVSLAALGAGLASPWYEVMWREDESLPQARLFLVEKGRLPQRGELVAFRMTPELAGAYRERPFARVGAVWLKRALGMPGDHLQVEFGQVYINGAAMAVLQERDSQGRPMQAAQLPHTILPDQYFVGLTHPRSFDSRYVGLLPASAIVGTALALW